MTQHRAATYYKVIATGKTQQGLKIVGSKVISELPFSVGLSTLRKGVAKVSDAPDLHSACTIIATHLDRLSLKVMAITFADKYGEYASVRPYRNQPEALVNLSRNLQSEGGCPILAHARTVGTAFDAKHLELPDETSFLAKRYLDELSKLPDRQILVFPVALGRGFAVFSIGTQDRQLNQQAKDELYLEICMAVLGLVSRFPELGRMFETRVLNALEAKCLLLMQTGATIQEISGFFDLHQVTVNLIIESAAEKMRTKSLSASIAKAQRYGEISNFTIGAHDLI